MPNPFREMLATDRLQWVLDADADGVDQVTVVGTPDRVITARINYLPEVESIEGLDGQRQYREATLLISTDATLGVASPAEGDEYSFDGLTWVQVGVAARLQRTFFRLTVRATTRTQASGSADYRRSGRG